MSSLAETAGLAWIDKVTQSPKEPHSGDELDFELPFHDPRTCLDAIVFVLSQIAATPANPHFQQLAAGPLENLLIQHGHELIDDIELLARREPGFRLLLNGAWLTQAPALVTERLAKYRTAPW